MTVWDSPWLAILAVLVALYLAYAAFLVLRDIFRNPRPFLLASAFWSLSPLALSSSRHFWSVQWFCIQRFKSKPRCTSA